MAVKLNIQANVTGQQQLAKLNAGLKSLGTQSLIAKRKLAALEAGAARSRATFAALGTTLRVGVGVGLAAVTFGIGKFVKDTFAAGKLTESLQVRFKLLFGTVKEGGKAFDVMNKFASKVPFSLEAIAAGSGNLAVISKDADELNKILEVTGNVAAATGLDFRQTAEQIQRSFAGGIASADVFRERGVRAMLGFEVGAKVSIEETRKRFFEVFANGGQFSKATKDFEQTLEAQVSFVQDAYFRFRQAAAKPLFAGLKEQLIELVGNFKENDEQLKALAKTVGENIAKGFKNLGKFIKLVIDNFDKLVTAVKSLIALKFAGIIGGIATQFVLLASNIRLAGGAALALNVALRANPIGLIISGLQIAVVAALYFKEELLELVDAIKNYFIRELKIAAKWVLWLGSKLKIFPTFAKNAGDASKQLSEDLKQMGRDANAVAASYVNLTKKQKAAFAGNLKDPTAEKRRNYQGANPRADMRNEELSRIKTSQEKELAESFKTKFRMRLENGAGYSGSDAIDGNKPGVKNDAHVKLHALKLKQIKEYRAQLSLVGIDSQKIGGIIGDTWLEGIKQGNSLLETTKNAFKNVLISISDTIVKRTAEVLVEKIFNSLIDQRIMKQKTLNAATSEQGNIMTGLISKAGSLLSMGSRGGGIGGKLGGLFGSLFSGGGGGGSNLMGIGSAKGFFGMAKGGVVPGGAPYTDRVPTMLTPGEVVIPRDKVGQQSGNTSITNINISGNVDQRSIDQIKSVISSASAEVGGANKAYTKNTQGVRGRNI